MEENNVPKSAYITLIIAVLVLGIGYYFWPKSKEGVPVQKNAQNTQTTPTQSPGGDPVANSAPTTSTSLQNNMHTITIETNKGSIVFETYDADAPNTVKNFVDLAQKGFYDGVIFHRVIKGFMIQGGDPTGTGTGGPGYKFADELNPATKSYSEGYKRGVVAMANAGPNTNGSQFFIMHADYPLPNNYTIFGKVVKGIEVVDAIANSRTGAGDRPVENIVMKKVIVEAK